MKLFVIHLELENKCPIEYLKKCLKNDRIKYIIPHSFKNINWTLYCFWFTIYFSWTNSNIFWNNYCEKFNSYCWIKNYKSYFQIFWKKMIENFNSNQNVLKKI